MAHSSKGNRIHRFKDKNLNPIKLAAASIPPSAKKFIYTYEHKAMLQMLVLYFLIIFGVILACKLFQGA